MTGRKALRGRRVRPDAGPLRSPTREGSFRTRSLLLTDEPRFPLMIRAFLIALITAPILLAAPGPLAAQSSPMIATRGEIGFAYEGSFHPADMAADGVRELFGTPDREPTRSNAGPYLDGATDLIYEEAGLIATAAPDSWRTKRLVFFLQEAGAMQASSARLDSELSPGASVEEAIEVYGPPRARRSEGDDLVELLGDEDVEVLLYEGDYFSGSKRMFKLAFRNGELAAVALLDNYAEHVPR